MCGLEGLKMKANEGAELGGSIALGSTAFFKPSSKTL
jgi:hypothetical protein